ncbi:FUSC family protein [Neobacillus jeddahensis]|uniref:FUSC family protein n=1 Tax=Neobacillus jeddahensis TaxID=1461580 RepID=UPI00058DC656|nr:FUSC family protein [Neobacillus jeddahensis]
MDQDKEVLSKRAGGAERKFDLSHTVAGLVGMAGSLVLGYYFNNLIFGLLASFGAMVVSGAASGETIRQRTIELTRAMIAGTSAVFMGTLIGGLGWLTGGCIVIISMLAALLGGMSRPAAIASTQFMMFTIIGTSMGGGELHPDSYKLPLYFATGSMFGLIVALIATFLLPAASRRIVTSPASHRIISQKLLKRWWHSLKHFSGWQFTLRVALCMSAAEVIGIFFQLEKSYWIALTVAIVLQRNVDSALTRSVQRGIGTAAGVILAGLLLVWTLPPWGDVLMVGIIAALRPIFKNRNYAVYSMLMTPMMVVMFSIGRTVTGALLLERLLDTIIGCGLSIVLGCYIWSGKKVSGTK